VVCSASTPEAVRPEHEVQIDFGYPRPSSPNKSSVPLVAISVRSDAGAWADRTLSEVEEQVERTWNPSRPVGSLIVIILMAVLLLVLMFSTFPIVRASPPRADDLWLKSSDVDRIETMLGSQPTLTEEICETLQRCNFGMSLDCRGLLARFRRTRHHTLCF
jgi:hypothetical protein